MKIKLFKVPQKIRLRSYINHLRSKHTANKIWKIYLNNANKNKVIVKNDYTYHEEKAINEILIRECYFTSIPIVCDTLEDSFLLKVKIELYVDLMLNYASDTEIEKQKEYYRSLIIRTTDKLESDSYVLVHPSCTTQVLHEFISNQEVHVRIHNGFAKENLISKLI